HVYFVVSAVFHYLGPSFAVLLFARVPVLGVAWLRIASAAVVFALWRRPWRALCHAGRDARALLVAWGAVLAVMNCCFYEAIARLPLGTVAAIEFLPVIVLAALGARTARNGAALALAVPGVYLLNDVRLAGEPPAVAFAAASHGDGGGARGARPGAQPGRGAGRGPRRRGRRGAPRAGGAGGAAHRRARGGEGGLRPGWPRGR